MAELEWELVVDGFGRLEAPCFDAAGRLCFADMRPPGKVYRLEPDGTVSALFDREHVGGLVPHAGGGLVATGPRVGIVTDDGAEKVLLTPDPGWGFNDFITDAGGDIFVGKFGERPAAGGDSVTGSLWRIGPRGVATHCYDGIQLTNGLGLSPDGSRLYHADTGPGVVWVSDINDAGLPVNRRLFYDLTEGSPDGMAVDESGCVLIATMAVGKITRVRPDGQLDQLFHGPQKWTASLCFGGEDGRDLYAVTFGGEPYDLERSGAVYRTRVDVAGMPIPPARV
jgi:xylono-1,5-lactonase